MVTTAVATWSWVKFECHAAIGAEVVITGTFNKWKPSRFHQLRDRHHDGTYRTLLQIQKGAQEYRYLVDGETPAGTESAQGTSC